MIERNRLEWVIDQHYRTIDRHYNQRVTTKSWCLTVWLFTLLFVSAKFAVLNIPAVILTSLPILGFWVIEGMQASHMKIMELRVAELERLWTSNTSKIKNPSDLLFYGSHQYQSARIKLDMLIHALFRMETVFAFYLLLLGLNLVVAVLLEFALPAG